MLTWYYYFIICQCYVYCTNIRHITPEVVWYDECDTTSVIRRVWYDECDTTSVIRRVWYDECDTTQACAATLWEKHDFFGNFVVVEIMLLNIFFIFCKENSFITGCQLMSISFGHLLSVLYCKMYMYMGVIGTVQITFIFIDFRVCDFAFAFKTQNASCVSRFKRVLFSDRFQFAF